RDIAISNRNHAIAKFLSNPNTKPTAKHINQNTRSSQNPPDPRALEKRIAKNLNQSLDGMVGLEKLKNYMAMDVAEFINGHQSMGRLYWGRPGVGKTELAQRLAGLREGFPALDLGNGGEVTYISGVDGKLEIRNLVDNMPPKSIVFIDEADKCLDPEAGMVTTSEATQIRQAIITHYQRKPIFWVFIGVYANMRNDQGGINDDIIRKNFGDELAHRLDYSDWNFPDWTLENLLKAVNDISSRRRLKYDPEAALALSEYCLKSGGGVRAFDNLETAILRHIRGLGIDEAAAIAPAIAQDVLAKRQGQAA
ncbi:MAG: AAA family ATPase, partial [Alphaproteobacteria bacterium]|nr:AAA family ATPase [Alphaproteobacteria bacterium]